MNDLPRERLCDLITQHGGLLCHETRRCENLLKDFCPDPSNRYQAEIKLLLRVLGEKIPSKLLSPSGEALQPRMRRHIAELRQVHSIEEDAATWAVESWALALGLVTTSELTKIKQMPAISTMSSGVTQANVRVTIKPPRQVLTPPSVQPPLLSNTHTATPPIIAPLRPSNSNVYVMGNTIVPSKRWKYASPVFLFSALALPLSLVGWARFHSSSVAPVNPTHIRSSITPSPSLSNHVNRLEASQSAQNAKVLNNKVSAKLSTLQDEQQRGILTEENATTAKAEMKPLLQEALANSEHAISLDNSNKDAWFQRVCTLYFWGKYPEADHYLRQATAKFPDCNDFDPLRPLIEKHLR